MLIVSVKRNRYDSYNINWPVQNQELLDNVRKLEKKSYDSGLRVWIMNSVNLYALIMAYKGRKDIFFDFGTPEIKQKFLEDKEKHEGKVRAKQEALQGCLDKQDQLRAYKKELFAGEVQLDYSGLLRPEIKLYEYQKKAALFGTRAGSYLLAADMGVGKSISALVTTLYRQIPNKVLIVVPNNLMYNWVNEVKKFTFEQAFILTQKKNEYPIEICKFVIVSYGFFSRSFSMDKLNTLLKGSKIGYTIFDEAHYLKNKKSNRGHNIEKYFKEVRSDFVFLTGTPMPNRIQELFYIFKALLPQEFTSLTKFKSEYCGLNYDLNKHMELQANSPDLQKLFNKLDSVMFRVLKKDVLKDLPKVTKNKVYIDLTDTERKEYERLESGFSEVDWDTDYFGKPEGNQNPLTVLMKLRQYLSSLKVDYVSELIDGFNSQGEKVVVFDLFKAGLRKLYELFPDKSVVYSGDIKDLSDRNNIINRFQQKDQDLMNLLITIQSGKEGLTLTRAHIMVMQSESWVPSENDQCYARVDRIGQEFPVFIYKPICKGTVDEDVDYVLEDKTRVIKQVVDNVKYQDESNKSVLDEVLVGFRKKYSKK